MFRIRRTLLAVVVTSALLAPLAATSSAVGAPTEHNVPFSTRWSADIHGTVTSVGNSIVTCDPTKPKRYPDAPDCLKARAQQPPTVGERAGRNNDYWMSYINIDGPGRKGPLRFDGTDPDHSYGTSADVTALVRAGGNGTYEVANLDAALAVDSWGGWSLVVGYENCDKPLRHLQVWDGYEHQAINSGKTVAVTLDGLHTPATGTVGLRLGQITYDGDRGWKDHVNVIPDVGTPFPLGDALSPVDDVQNSVLANNDWHDSNYRWQRNPDYANTLGYDNHRFLLDGKLANGTSRLTVDYPSTGEGTNIGAVYAVVDLAP